MRSELLIQANNLMRSYLLRHQIDAVKFTFQLVPSDTLSVLSEHWESRTGLTDLPADVEVSICEYLCVKTYIDAFDAFNYFQTEESLNPPGYSPTCLCK